MPTPINATDEVQSEEKKITIPEEKDLKDGINYKISKFIDEHRVGVGATIVGACTAIGAIFGGIGALPGAGIGATIAGFALKASQDTVQRAESNSHNTARDGDDIKALSETRSRTATVTKEPHNHHVADVNKAASQSKENSQGRQ